MSLDYLHEKENVLNGILNERGYVDFNDVLKELGLPVSYVGYSDNCLWAKLISGKTIIIKGMFTVEECKEDN